MTRSVSVMIDSIRLQDFKGHSDTTVSLGRLTMLVGDNASGKTSVLEALSLLCACGPSPVYVLHGDRAPMDMVRRTATGGLQLTARGAQPVEGQLGRYVLKVGVVQHAPPDPSWLLTLGIGATKKTIRIAYNAARGIANVLEDTQWNEIPAFLGTAQIYRLEAKAVAAGAFGGGQTDQSIDESGANTAAVLANMKLDRDEDFQRVEEALRKLVPSLRRIRLQPVSLGGPTGHKIYFDFENASGIPAHGASHGTLIALALLTAIYGPRRPNLLLLDDFDHALHPRAQMELVKMLKALLELPEFSTLQIVATTHSPYVLDELSPKDVQVFALRTDGTVSTKRLSEHPQASSTEGMLSAGQLWSLDPERDWVVEK